MGDASLNANPLFVYTGYLLLFIWAKWDVKSPEKLQAYSTCLIFVYEIPSWLVKVGVQDLNKIRLICFEVPFRVYFTIL